MVTIPRKKTEVLCANSRDGHDRPALNVKCYSQPEYTPERIRQEFGCTEAAAIRAAEWCYESAFEHFWQYSALDALNFAMLGDAKATHYKPFGLADGPYKVYSEGRSGGWLVVEGLPPVHEWDGPTFQKWRKFARMIREEMAHYLTFEYAREMIEANEWAPRADSADGQRQAIRHDKSASDRALEAFFAIHGELDGKEWGTDTLDRIAGHVRAAGLAIREPEAESRDACSDFYEGSMGRCVHCGLQKSAHRDAAP